MPWIPKLVNSTASAPIVLQFPLSNHKVHWVDEVEFVVWKIGIRMDGMANSMPSRLYVPWFESGTHQSWVSSWSSHRLKPWSKLKNFVLTIECFNTWPRCRPLWLLWEDYFNSVPGFEHNPAYISFFKKSSAHNEKYVDTQHTPLTTCFRYLPSYTQLTHPKDLIRIRTIILDISHCL